MDVAVLSALVKLVGDGVFIVLIALLYIKDRNKRQEEYDSNRKILQKNYEEIKKARESEYQSLIKNYNKIVGDIVNGVNTHHLTPEEGKSIAQIEKQINDIVKTMLKDTNASRVCIVKYHNGNKDMTGMSFLKMSMTNEAVNVGVAPLMPDFQSHFRSLLAFWCHKIDEVGECMIEDTEDLANVDVTMYEYLKTRNIEAKYGMSLRDTGGNVIGFICVEYLDKDDFNKEDVIEIVKNGRLKLETLTGLNGGGCRCGM